MWATPFEDGSFNGKLTESIHTMRMTADQLAGRPEFISCGFDYRTFLTWLRNETDPGLSYSVSGTAVGPSDTWTGSASGDLTFTPDTTGHRRSALNFVTSTGLQLALNSEGALLLVTLTISGGLCYIHVTGSINVSGMDSAGTLLAYNFIVDTSPTSPSDGTLSILGANANMYIADSRTTTDTCSGSVS